MGGSGRKWVTEGEIIREDERGGGRGGNGFGDAGLSICSKM